MKTNVKSAVSLVAVTVFSAIVFGNAIADTPKPVNAFALIIPKIVCCFCQILLVAERKSLHHQCHPC